MTALTLPAPDAHASEWGALAVSIPGWPWMPGMLGYNDYGGTYRIMDHSEASQINADLTPDPDDPATAGCLWEMAGRPTVSRIGYRIAVGAPPHWVEVPWHQLGRACIAYAAALGRWPGGGA
jgi:hypothetical protein